MLSLGVVPWFIDNLSSRQVRGTVRCALDPPARDFWRAAPHYATAAHNVAKSHNQFKWKYCYPCSGLTQTKRSRLPAIKPSLDCELFSRNLAVGWDFFTYQCCLRYFFYTYFMVFGFEGWLTAAVYLFWSVRPSSSPCDNWTE